MMKQLKSTSSRRGRLFLHLFLFGVFVFGNPLYAVEPVSEIELKKATYKLIMEMRSIKKELKGLRIHPTATKKVTSSIKKTEAPQKSRTRGSKEKQTVYGKYIQDFIERNRSVLEAIKEDNV